jgi:hypothetical protein
MFTEEKKSGASLARSVAGTALKDLVFQAFMWISVIITAIIAYNIQSWWPFAGWFVVVLAFGWWMGN